MHGDKDKSITQKLSLPIAIVLASIILGGFFYAVQVNKQNSIERQQELELQEERRQHEAELLEQRIAEEGKSEQAKKEYVADRKKDCLSIYETEADKWNNVQSWRYDEDLDTCYIRYKDPNPKTDAECEENWSGPFFWRERAICKDGHFENSF